MRAASRLPTRIEPDCLLRDLGDGAREVAEREAPGQVEDARDDDSSRARLAERELGLRGLADAVVTEGTERRGLEDRALAVRGDPNFRGRAEYQDRLVRGKTGAPRRLEQGRREADIDPVEGRLGPGSSCSRRGGARRQATAPRAPLAHGSGWVRSLGGWLWRPIGATAIPRFEQRAEMRREKAAAPLISTRFIAAGSWRAENPSRCWAGRRSEARTSPALRS